MKRIFCYIIIIFLLLLTIYINDGYNRRVKINNELRKKNQQLSNKLQNIKKENIHKHFIDALVDINLLHKNSNFVKDTLYARAKVYFYYIETKQDEIFLKNLTPDSRVCQLWNNNTKQKYINQFELYKQDAVESNITRIEQNTYILKGLDTIDTLCSR